MKSFKDAGNIKKVNLPAAAGTAVSPAINIGTGPHTEGLEGRALVPTVAGLADDKDLTVTVEHCDTEDGEFTAIAAVAAQVKTGAGGVGASALDFSFRFPPDTKAWVRAKAALEAAGGDITDKELTFGIAS